MTYTLGGATDDAAKINDVEIWYNTSNNTVVWSIPNMQRYTPVEEPWVGILLSHISGSFIELTNPTFMNYVCYLIETGQIEV
jgi:hypothetical protein